MTSINDISDLAQVLQDNPQWREIIRAILLGDELLHLPNQMAEFVQAVNRSFQLVNERLERLEAGQERLEANQERLENDFAGLRTGQERLEANQERLENDFAGLRTGQERLEANQATMSGRLGNIIGHDYERRAAKVARRRLRHLMGVSEAQIIVASWEPGENEITPLINDAAAQGVITEEQADDLELADLVLRRRTPESETRYVVAETSIRIDRNDITRVGRRADLLARVVAAPVLAAVIGESASPEDLEFATERNIPFLQVEPPR